MNIKEASARCACACCSDQGCKLLLKGLQSPYVILNLECLRDAERVGGHVCDRGVLLGDDKFTIVVIEFKGGQVHDLKLAIEQLQNGLHLLEGLVDKPVQDVYPILVYRGQDPTPALVGRKVSFKSFQRSVTPFVCGSNLANILKNVKSGPRPSRGRSYRRPKKNEVDPENQTGGS